MQNKKNLIVSDIKPLVHKIAFLLICALILMTPALYNGFPLVNPDSGGNIGVAYNLHVPIERPISYSVLLRIATSIIHSLWMIVLLQTVIVVYILNRVSKKLLSNTYSNRIFLAIIILLTFFTSCSWHTSHILPDILTAAVILLVVDFLLLNTPNKNQKIIYFIAIWLLLEQHNSNLLIALILSLCLFIYAKVKQHKPLLQKTIFIFIITLFSFVSISFFNLWEGNSFRPSASTHIFMMARMAENGILDEFLKENCPTNNYSICNYQGRTGNRQWDFMWVDGHLIDNGGHPNGWFTTEKEYKQIIRKTLVTPKYLLKHIYESIEGTFRQLTQIHVGIMIEGEGSSPFVNIEQRFPYELKEYRTALQPTANLIKQMPFFNAIIYIFFVSMVLLAILFYYHKNVNQNFKNIFAFIIAAVICNAFVTSTFSTVVERLQSRVSWLIPYMCILMLINVFNAQRIFVNHANKS